MRRFNFPRFDWVDDGYFVTEERDLRQIKRVLIITMLLNFLAMGIKVVAGVFTGALSLVADGIDSLFDGISNAVGLAGLYIAGKPPDAEHPYGHRKFETIAALTISFLLFLTSFQLLGAAWERFRYPEAPNVNIWTAIALVAAMGVQAGTSFYELRAGKKLNSEVLVADAMHTRASILVSASVLAGLLLVRLGFPQADPLITVLIALFIAKIGVDILIETVPVLVDQAPIDPQRIADEVQLVDGVESFHRVRSRGALGSAAVDLHVRISPQKTMREADLIADNVRQRLLALESVTDVTVHVEAQRGSDLSPGDRMSQLKRIAREVGLTMHETEFNRLEGNLFLDVHLGVDPSLTLGEAHDLVESYAQTVKQQNPDIDEIHTHIEMASTQVQQGVPAPERIQHLVEVETKNIIANMPALQNPHQFLILKKQNEDNGFYVSFECMIAADMPISTAHQYASQVERELIQRIPEVIDVSVHLEPPRTT